MWEITVCIILLTVCLFLLWRRKQLLLLEGLGIPGPEPNLIFGNLLEIIRKGLLKCQKEWFEKYGKVVGFYVFTIPVVLVADVEVIKKIQISDFQKFINRPFSMNPPKGQKGGDMYLHLFNFRDKKWKDTRSILTPTFTTSKIRGMTPIINDAIDMLLDNIGEKALKKESFDIYKFYQGLTMDVIGRTAFGIKTNCQKDENDGFLKLARVLISGGISSYLFMISASFPKLLSRRISKIPLVLFNGGKDPNLELFDNIRNIIQERKKETGVKRQDLLQLMIDANLSESELSNIKISDLTAGGESSTGMPDKNVEDKNSSSGKILRHIEDEEIVDNAALFIGAGYETTSATLAYITHILIHYPDIQEKLRREINDLEKKEGKLDYVFVNQLQYMDQVINETLRMYPPINTFVNREAGEDVDFGTFRIKKGMTVLVSTYCIQHDPDYWENPETFDPERFSPENKPNLNMLAFQAFGGGPRNCIGMRFAFMEIKLALTRILQKYKLVKSEKSDEIVPKLRETPVSLTPLNGVHLKAVPI